jgi:hypothetical protein
MKKVFKSAMAIALLATLTSCKKKDNEATPLANATGSARIEGLLLCDKDLVNNLDNNGSSIKDNIDTDPANGAVLKITTKSKINSGNDVTQTVVVDATGKYSFSVPAISSGATVEIEVLDYVSQQKFSYFENGTKKEVTEAGFFPGRALSGGSVTVYPNELKIIPRDELGGFVSTVNPSKK